jgi:RHS repeat-associated protein
MGYGGADGTRQKFTQKERDSESGLDYFGARYYSSAQGRFTSADEILVDQWLRYPQSWNLYTYVGNNPLSFVDRFGLWKEIEPGVWQWQEGDTWESLAKILKVNVEDLQNAFPDTELGAGVALQPGDLSAGTPTQAKKACWCVGERLGNWWSYERTLSNDELEVDVAYKRKWLNEHIVDKSGNPIDYSGASTLQVLQRYDIFTSGAAKVYNPPDVPGLGIGAHKYAGKTVAEILKGKKGSITNAPLEQGAPGWDQIRSQTWEQIESGASAGKPGYKTIKKLLTDGRFDK